MHILNNQNRWIVLLTTAVNNPEKSMPDTDYRKELYTKQINRWLNETKYDVVVVESSGYTFPDIQHDRLHKISITIDKKLPSSSQYEAISILYALQQIANTEYYRKCTHILKVTGRYFLENIERVLNSSEQDKDLYLQKHFTDGWQNSEYYGIRKWLYNSFIKNIKVSGLMEAGLCQFAVNKTVQRIGTFPNNIRRGGDNMLITNL